jgi:photosystem II stability/assembly factor-like uncharacterized protein
MVQYKKGVKPSGRPLGLFLLLIGLLVFSSPVSAAIDLLTRPAGKARHVTEASFMDVTRAGDRLVAAGELGYIIYSDDQGRSWTQAEVPTSVTLTAVFFPTATHGWAVGHDSIVLHSSDAGQSWRKQLDGNDVNPMVLEATAAMVDQQKKKLAAAAEADREELAFALEDATYSLKDAKVAVQEGPTKPFMDVWFADENHGVIVGAFGMIFRTEDGGKTWTAQFHRIENSQGYHFNGLAATREALLLVGETGILYRSPDQGKTWEKLPSPYDGSLFGIVSDPAGDRAIAVGLRGNIVETLDDGATWQHRQTPLPAAINGGAVLAGGGWVLVGLAGQALTQVDLHIDFSLVPTKFPGCMAAVESGDGHVVMVGRAGVRRIAFNNLNQ